MERGEWFAVGFAIALGTVILAFSFGELRAYALLISLLVSAIVVLLSVLSKKFTAKQIDVKVNLKIWEFQRYGITTSNTLKKPFPIGLILPLLLSLISRGFVTFLAFLQFDAKASSARVVKKYGLRRFSGIMEWDDALIVFYSALPLMILAIASSFFDGSLVNLLSRGSIIYVISNLIPLGQLDGTKLFFGSKPLFVCTWILAAVSCIFVFF
jgi:hypothetical protein